MDKDPHLGLSILPSKHELSRRQALKLLAGCVAAAQSACIEAPGDEVRPYARLPPEVVPGRPKQFATTMVFDGFATGLVVESHEGRPTKVEGNPRHPASLGGTSAVHQASVLDLYDPDRAKSVSLQGKPSSWDALFTRLHETAGPLWLVVEPTSSPLERALISQIMTQRPGSRVVVSGAAVQHNAYEGAKLAFGRPLELQLDLRHADVVVALDADLLSGAPMSLRWAREFAERRRDETASSPSRLYAIEPMLSATGALADHRLALPAGAMLSLVLALADQLQTKGLSLPHSADTSAAIELRGGVVAPEQRKLVQVLADDLLAHKGRAVIAVGARQPPACHAVAHVLNAALGNLGSTVTLTEPVLGPLSSNDASLEDLADALRARAVSTVVVLDCNPVYRCPPGQELAKLLRAAPLTVHVACYRDETSAACAWHAPLSHYLESWGNARAPDGTLSIQQPLIQPLYDTRGTAEVLAQLAGIDRPRGLALVRESLRAGSDADSFPARWQDALSAGVVRDSAFASVPAVLVGGAPLAVALRQAVASGTLREGVVEVDLRLSPTIHDERFANNAWLQELPHPRTKQTWGNAALLSRSLAEQLGVEDGVVLRLRRAGHQLEVPVFVVPEHADGCVTLELGYGRSSADEKIARGVGANANLLMLHSHERILSEISVERTARRERMACTQNNLEQHERELAPVLTVAALTRAPRALEHLRKNEPSTLPVTLESAAPQWAMTIDTTVCSGCSACVIACQSENNIPVVGKSEVYRGREMHWLRIDTYLIAGSGSSRGSVVNQPMMCQHCEHAPCEYVCPVFATEHSPDGLNEMVYNRCIGTRFCQANCPYKVRRFNWLHYSADDGSTALQKNPEVTVRDRGVMEKCTYCVQRIRHAEYQSRMEEREIRPGEVVTACQQACPTQAIQFGALRHSDTPMVQGRQSERAYAVLGELGARPRTMYLAKLQNPHPGLGDAT